MLADAGPVDPADNRVAGRFRAVAADDLVRTRPLGDDGVLDVCDLTARQEGVVQQSQNLRIHMWLAVGMRQRGPSGTCSETKLRL